MHLARVSLPSRENISHCTYSVKLKVNYYSIVLGPVMVYIIVYIR